MNGISRKRRLHIFEVFHLLYVENNQKKSSILDSVQKSTYSSSQILKNHYLIIQRKHNQIWINGKSSMLQLIIKLSRGNQNNI